MIKMEHVTKYLGGTPVLEDIELEIADGEVCSVIGLNGSGKTTLVKLLCGIISSDKGMIHVQGTQKVREYKQYISLLLSDTRNLYWKMTVKENIEFCLALRGQKCKENKKKVADLLKRFSLDDTGKNTVQELSRGMQQKLALAIALSDDAPIMILDEPTLGLDTCGVDTLCSVIQELKSCGKTFIIVSHDFNFLLRVTDNICYLKRGKMVKKFGLKEIKSFCQGKQLEISVKHEYREKLKQINIDAEETYTEGIDTYGFTVDGIDETIRILSEFQRRGIEIESFQYRETEIKFITSQLEKLLVESNHVC